MEVKVKLFNLLRQYAPGDETVFPIQLASGATLETLLAQLKIPTSTPRTVLINGRRADKKTHLSSPTPEVLSAPISSRSTAAGKWLLSVSEPL